MKDGKLHLLAIDDNPDNLVTLRALISDAFPSAILETSLTGIQGIQKAIAGDPDMIFLDVLMPGIDGLDICRMIKSDDRISHIPVIILTALGSNRQTRIDALEAGADAFLPKPPDPVELTAQVRAMARLKAAGDMQRDENDQLVSLVRTRTIAIEKELEERRKTELELQKANLRLKETQAATLNLLEDLSYEMEIRKSYAAELVRAKERAEESDRLKSAFLANMSHEIRTPMNGIIGFSGFLAEPDLNAAERDRFLKIINDNCQQLLHIVSDIIDISKIEAGVVDLESVDFCLNELMDNLYQNYHPRAAAKGLSLSLYKDLECDDCSIANDQSKLRQVLDNLLTNALKFTDRGEIKFGYHLVNSRLQFFVADTGIGIDPANHEAVFNRFWQVETGLARQYGGTGLGLSISRAFIREMGGVIRCDSVPGKGSQFNFDLPYVHSVHKQNTPAPGSCGPEGIGGKTILVVEDEEYNFEFLRIILLKYHLKTLHAWNGEEAIKIFSGNREIDLVLMDFKLPDIPGQEVTRRLLELRRGVPVIATTAYAMTGDREKAVNAGCIDYLQKPIRVEELVGLLNKYLVRKGLPG